MPVERVMDGFDQIDVLLPDNLLESWRAQVNRALFMVATGSLSLRLAASAGEELDKRLDLGLRPQPGKWLHYATATANGPNGFLGGDVLRYLGSIAEFPNRLADIYKGGWCRGSDRDRVPYRLDAAISRAHSSTTRGETCSTRDDARHDDDCTRCTRMADEGINPKLCRGTCALPCASGHDDLCTCTGLSKGGVLLLRHVQESR